MKKICLILIVLFISTSLYPLDESFEKKYNLKSQVDEENGIIWYRHKKGSGGNTKIYPYIGKRTKSEECFLRMVILYAGPQNLFVKEYVFTVDDVEHILIPRKKIETVEAKDNFLRSGDRDMSGGIVEVYDVAANQEEFELMEKISRAKTVKLKYIGVIGFKRKPIHKTTKKAMGEVLAAYKELMGISQQHTGE
ncbi:MAG: hypothetical protein WBF32_03265 [Candidatus Aminicenantaceae bacterium]